MSTVDHADLLRRYARILLRRLHSDSLSTALPVARRILNAQVLPPITLTTLFKTRTELRLKHVLRMLAAELGYPNWEACKLGVQHRPSCDLDACRLDMGAYGEKHRLWFPAIAPARKWQSQHGGVLVPVGLQAVVLTD